MATNGNHNHGEQHAASASSEAPVPATTSSDTTSTTQKADLPKDEVGWYFVEQYYTTLSKNPDKLHLFYGKQSQFVYGKEADLADVSLGRSAIQERIKGLDYKDCKVRISNVDSQGSGDCIVIQVIGETSHNLGEPKKFVQTFVLAQQPSGYFVLNDILRYIQDPDEEVPEQAPVETKVETRVPTGQNIMVEDMTLRTPRYEMSHFADLLSPGTTPQPRPLDPDAIAKKIEAAKAREAEIEAEAEASAAAASAAEESVAEETPAAAEPTPEVAPEATEEEESPESVPDPEKAAEEIAEEEVKKPEDPKAPTPTPAVAPVAPVATPIPAEPEKPKEPPKPMSWANRVAQGAGAQKPAVTPKTVATPAPTQARPAAAPAKQPTPAAPAKENTPTPAASQDQGNEWQTAETKRQNRPQSQVAAPAEKETASGYVKYVTEKISTEDLRAALEVFGELSYCDINRSKNCAFVEFKTQAGYNAAVAANPHTVNGESIVVEQRRPKTDQFRGTGFNGPRGGAAGRGRGGFETGRSGSQSGRGGFPGQTRGGRGGAPRGRGVPANNA